MAENKKKSSGMRKGVLAVALLCGIGAVGGIVRFLRIRARLTAL